MLDQLETDRLYKLVSLGPSFDNAAGEGRVEHITHKVYDLLQQRLLKWLTDDNQNDKKDTIVQRWLRKHGHKEKYRDKLKQK